MARTLRPSRSHRQDAASPTPPRSHSGPGASPPTARALDVIELLARRAGRPATLAELTRELGITRATAHAIVTTLVARGWLERDPLDKSLAIGPGLGLAARSADAARPLEHAARAAAEKLARELGCAASVTQVVGDVLVILHFVTPPGSTVLARAGDRVPFAAPFAQTFVAWEPARLRREWMERSALSRPALAARLERVLAAIRARGYGVERMSRAASEALRLVAALRDDPLSASMRAIIDRLLTELSTVDYLPGELAPRAKHPVSTIAAPVFDERGRVRLNLGIHPFRDLAVARIQRCGRTVARAASAVSRGRAPAPDAGA